MLLSLLSCLSAEKISRVTLENQILETSNDHNELKNKNDLELKRIINGLNGEQSNLKFRPTTALLLLLFLAIIGTQPKYSGATPIQGGMSVIVTSKPITVLDADTSNSEVYACFCNGNFFRTCPKYPGCIITKHRPFGSSRDNEKLSGLHDADHPDYFDHNEMLDSSPFNNDDPWETFGGYPMKAYESSPDDALFAIRRRKVYLDKKSKNDSFLRPINITIPLVVEDNVEIPEPKPIYRLHKYTTIAQEPETKMVPVTKTIIKPAGVSDSQIISGVI